jgi:mRNA-degrading endonuclease HigB of HigAB toxin-antitoxin module
LGVIDRIDHEVKRLNADIVEKKEFYGKHGVNLNALVCLLRYAAWKEPERLKKWIMRPGCDWDQASINPKIVKRFSLYEPDGDDGAQLRIHIFDDAEDTSKHNHQRSFITMCIQGSYEYRYYKIDEQKDAPSIEIWKRVDGNFVKDRHINANIRRVSHSHKDDEGTDINPDKDTFVFGVESDPLYVNDEWIHTVHPHNTDEEVITVLIRREKAKEKGDTIFVKEPDDKDFEEEDEPYDADEGEIDDMFFAVKKALVGDAEIIDSEFKINTNVIQEFMLPKSKIARVRPALLRDQHCFTELRAFMSLNKFSFTPVTENRNGVEKLIKFIDIMGTDYFESTQDWLDPNTPILFGIMYTILSPNYIVPIVDKKTDEFLGILSLHDIMNNMSRLAGPMIQSSIDANKGNSVNAYSELMSSLVELNNVVEKDNYSPDDAHTEAINKVLAALNKLILDKKLVNLNISDTPNTIHNESWLDEISGDVFFVDPDCKSNSLLRELHRTGNFSTFVESIDDTFEIISLLETEKDRKVRTLEKLDSNSTAQELIDWIRESKDHWPVYTYSKTHKRLGIISTDELFSRIGIQKIAEQLNAITDDKKGRILSKLLIKSHQRRPNFDEEEFNLVRDLFL